MKKSLGIVIYYFYHITQLYQSVITYKKGQWLARLS